MMDVLHDTKGSLHVFRKSSTPRALTIGLRARNYIFATWQQHGKTTWIDRLRSARGATSTQIMVHDVASTFRTWIRLQVFPSTFWSLCRHVRMASDDTTTGSCQSGERRKSD